MYSTREDYVGINEQLSENFNEEIPNSIGLTNINNIKNVDRDLYNDLVQIVPLVQSLIERKASSSFTRRGSMIYTKTPSKDSKKNGVKSTKKHRDNEQGKESKNDQDGVSDNSSTFAANMAAEKDKEELTALREQLEDLHQKLLEKDELLKAVEVSKNQMSSVQSQVDELKRSAAEKDSLIKSIQSQVNDAKIKLAEKQAALEKLQWEAKTSNQKVEILQEELDSLQSEISSLMIIFEGLSKDGLVTVGEDYDVTPHFVDHLPNIDDLDEIELLNMEEAREAYVTAVEMAKEKQDEESLYAAARARYYLQSFVFRTESDT
ncbi:protein MICROTUBULE BINDING PROTEIN 2C-like [Silene latifolia]|uniref:protein MICROTUBULE BINDING PROTEIN 2C-like n=1 Tax=Silene latifolia TaxID=37657 RepID=UPI003D77B9F1